MLSNCRVYASHHCLEAERDLVGRWQWSVLPQVVHVDDSRQGQLLTTMQWCTAWCIYILYTHSPSDSLCSTASLLDAVPAWQQCTTRVERCSAISVMCAVWVAAWYQSHTCWYSICDDFALKYVEGVYWIVGTPSRLYRVQHCAAQLRRCASHTGIMRNVSMHLCKIIWYGWCCGQLPTRWWCA